MSDKPADLDFWDGQDLLTVSEIAWLWCGLEPPKQGRMYWTSEGRPERPPDPPLSRAEIIQFELLSSNKDPNDLLKAVDNHPRKIVGTIAFLRSDLRAWAERQGYQPLFLFPELRPEKQSGLSLGGALAVVDALARLAHPTWDSDKRAYGLIPRIQQAGCNLDRRQIGNYLKEARKIKKIG